MEISQAREKFVQTLVAKNMSPHTIRAYDGDIRAFETYAGPTTSVLEVDSLVLSDFTEAQLAAGLAAESIKRRRSALRSFLRWLAATGLRGDDGADTSLEMPALARRTRKLPRIVPADQVHRLLRSLCVNAGVRPTDARPRLRKPHESTTLLAVTLMLATGIRVSELAGIDCRDIDVAGGSLRLLGKGRRERAVFLTNDWIGGLMTAYLKARAELRLEHSSLLFNRRNRPLTASGIRTRLHAAARKAGLSASITPHMLRHTAATQLIEAGVDIRFIQRLLGHASLSTTEIYTHVSDRALRRVVRDADVLEKLLAGGR